MTISGRASLAGVVGWPVAQSRSPLMHNHWISVLGLEAAYVPLAIKPEDFAACVRALPRMGFKGVNVTVPHKQAALEICDKLDEAAARIGAVNTLVFSENGAIEGRNTDVVGFEACLEAASCDDIDGSTAVVLGAGGAARAIVAALIHMGVKTIRVCNRTLSRAQSLADTFRKQNKTEVVPVGWDDRDDALDSASLLVNATSLGMKGQPRLEIDLSPLSRGAIVADIVYSPLETPLLAMARELGFPSVGGLRMLIEQARPGFEAWFGEAPPVTKALIEMLEADLKMKGG